MEKRVHIRTDCAKGTFSPEANNVSMKTSNRSQLSTEDQQVIKKHALGAATACVDWSCHWSISITSQNRVRDYRLVQLLKNSQLKCWLSEICAGRVALQLLTAGLFLLFVWLLAELHVVLPCFLLCGCLFHGPFRRAVNTIWAWIRAVVEKVPHTDGCTGIKCEKAWWKTKPSLYCNLTETSIFIFLYGKQRRLVFKFTSKLILVLSLVLVVIDILPGKTCMSLEQVIFNWS